VTVSAIHALFTMTATVEPFLGAGPNGDEYGSAVTVRGFLDDGDVLVRGSQGEQLVSTAKFYCDLSWADVFTNESRVTVNGDEDQVTKVRRRDADGFGGPSHLEIDLS
jgi:hypothetical protein